MQYPQYVSTIIERLEEHGFEAYIVGGSVRDTVMGRIPNDYDITTSALPEQTLEIFRDMRTIPTGIKHGTVTIISEGNPIEVTTFRIDGEYKDSRHPDSISFTDSIAEDLSRRDFTVNAMAYNQARGLVDPFGGKEDIERKLIRAVGEPKKRFEEDALRIMRAFRFSAQLGFDIDPETLLATRILRDRLSQIARERISTEFLKLISSRSADATLKAMKENLIMPFVFGEYLPSDPLICAISRAPCAERVRLGILLSEANDSQKKSALSGLRLSSKMYSNIFTISTKYTKHLAGNDVRARQFIGECGDLVTDVLAAADALGNLDDEFERLVRENIEKKVCTATSELAINGSDLVKLGIKGKAVGNTLAQLLDTVLGDPSANERKKLLHIAAKLNNIEKE